LEQALRIATAKEWLLGVSRRFVPLHEIARDHFANLINAA